MKYKTDLRKISTREFKDSLKSRSLIPSRKILLENIDKNFSQIEKLGIGDLARLYDFLKTKKKLANLSEKSSIDIKYLRILKREISSFVPKPIRLEDFPGFDEEFLFELELEGFTSSLHVFEDLQSQNQRNHFANKKNISITKLNQLYALCDLSRIYGVGAVFAKIIYESDIKSVGDFLNIDAEEACRRFSELYKNKGYKRIDFKPEDLQLSKFYARYLEL